MQSFVTVLLVLAMVATLAVLVVGIIGMARGGEFNARYGNKLMRLRILMQGVAVVLFVILMVVVGPSYPLSSTADVKAARHGETYENLYPGRRFG